MPKLSGANVPNQDGEKHGPKKKKNNVEPFHFIIFMLLLPFLYW